MKEVLKYIKDQLQGIGINYAFLRWNKEIAYPYFVGSYNSPEPTIEDQRHDPTFTLEGFMRGSWDELEKAREKIETLFEDNRAILPSGSCVVITYAGDFPIPIDEGELKRIQINLKIKEWRVR